MNPTLRLCSCAPWLCVAILSVVTLAEEARALGAQPEDPTGLDPAGGAAAYTDPSESATPTEAFDHGDDDDPFVYAPEVRRSLTTRAAHQDYHFCHEPAYVLHVAERPLCPLAEAATPVCPEFRTACAKPESEDRSDGSPGVFGGRKAGRGGDVRANEEREEKEREPLKLPAGLGVLFRVLFWVLIVVLVGTIVFLLASAWARSARERRVLEPEDGTDEPGRRAEAGEALRTEVESDVHRLLQRAKTRAREGQYGPAIDDVYAALLRHLEGEQLLVLERHRTNGDYVRALHQHQAWQRLVRECGRDVERAQFGHRGADSATFQRLLERIEPSLSRALGWALALVTSLASLACDGSSPPTPESPKKEWGPLGDHGPSGLSLFPGLLADSGYTVRHRIKKTTELDEEIGLLIVYDDTSLEDEDWTALETWVASGRALWLLGDREAAQHFGGAATGLACGLPLELTDAYAGDRLIVEENGTTRPLRLTSVSGSLVPRDDLTPVLTCAGVPMVSQKHVGTGTVTFFADASVLTNAALMSADNAVFVMSLAQAFPTTIEFAGGLTGAGAESPYQALMNAKLGPVLLQIALLMLLWYLARGIPFATLRDPPEVGRRRFLDHLEALGRLFQRARAEHHALHHYASWALGRLNERVRPGQRMSVIELSASLAKRTGRSRAEVLETLAEAASAKNQPQTASSGGELDVLKRLETFVSETGGAR